MNPLFITWPRETRSQSEIRWWRTKICHCFAASKTWNIKLKKNIFGKSYNLNKINFPSRFNTALRRILKTCVWHVQVWHTGAVRSKIRTFSICVSKHILPHLHASNARHVNKPLYFSNAKGIKFLFLIKFAIMSKNVIAKGLFRRSAQFAVGFNADLTHA